MMDDELNRLRDGYRLQGGGRLAEAEQVYRGLLARRPDNVHALNLLGALCVNTGRPQEALPLIERAVSLAPDDADAWSNLGLALKDLRLLPRAVDAFTHAARLNPRSSAAHNRLGNALAETGRVDDAIRAYHAALGITPDYTDCLNNLAGALLSRGELDAAWRCVERALRIDPRSAQAHHHRGEILRRRFSFEAAVAAYRTAIELRPGYESAWINLATVLKDTGEVAQARRILEEVVSRQPSNAQAQTSLGGLLEQLGDPVGAAACFRLALASAPNYAQAYYQLSRLDPARSGGEGLHEAEAAAAAALLEDAATSEEDRAPLAFALAADAERRGDIDRSFRYLQRAQSIKGRKLPYDDAQVRRYYDSIKTAFSAPLGNSAAGHASGAPLPVFVVGMPRSGTSLTEQILASHPRVIGAGELSFIDDALEEVTRLTGRPFPAGFAALDHGRRSTLGKTYMSRLVQRHGAADRIIDKTPMNFQYIGFIAAILPEARFIHCTRDPVDNCLSIFKLPFDDRHSYAHDLEALGRFYRRYVDLMRHWMRQLPGRIAEVRYEDLVGDVDAGSRRLLRHLGLDYDPAVAEFYNTRRIVRTPSASQVRRPIYRSSLRAWVKYQAHLGPLLAALGESPPAAQ